MAVATLVALALAADATLALGAEPAPPPVSPVWSAATKLTLPGSLQPNPNLTMTCTSPGNCVAVGNYEGPNGIDDYLPLAATESNGVWAPALPLPLPSNADPQAGNVVQSTLRSVSCTSVGDCVAVGSYLVAGNGSATLEALVATEVGGAWHLSQLAALPAGALSANLYGVSCWSAGDCIAVGSTNGDSAAMVAYESQGTWNPATAVAQPGNVNAQPNAVLASVSCTVRTGITHLVGCTAAGYYADSNGHIRTMATNWSGGPWPTPSEVAPPNASTTLGSSYNGLLAVTPAVSCTTPLNCVIVGNFVDTTGASHAMVASESGGGWTSYGLTPPSDESTTVPADSLDAVSCTSVGNCTAGGLYLAASADAQTGYVDRLMVTTEVAGQWTRESGLTQPSDGAQTDPITVGLPANIRSLSCSSATNCTALGYYTLPGGGAAPLLATIVPALSVSTNALPSGVVGSAYSAQLKANGGDAGNYAWSLASGALPAGLSLDATTGVISGTPTAAGTSSFTITVSEPELSPSGQQATASLSIAITAQPSSSSEGSSNASSTNRATASIAKVKVEANKATLVTLSCHGSASQLCAGTLALSAVEHLSGHTITAVSAAKRNTRTVALGRAAYKVTGGASATFTIKLSATAKSLLSHRHRFPSKLTLTVAGAKTAAVTKTITLAR